MYVCVCGILHHIKLLNGIRYDNTRCIRGTSSYLSTYASYIHRRVIQSNPYTHLQSVIGCDVPICCNSDICIMSAVSPINAVVPSIL